MTTDLVPDPDARASRAIRTIESVTEIMESLHGGPATAPAARPTKRDQILQAAIELFAAHGFESVRMRQLATQVGLSAPGLYAHFDSKESIIAAAMKQALARFIEAVLIPIRQEAPSRRLDGLIRRHICFQLKNLSLAKANDELLDSASIQRFLPTEDYSILVRAQRTYYQVLRDAINAEAPAASRKQVQLATFALLAMCDRVTTWYCPQGALTADEVAEHYTRLARSIVDCLGAD